LIKKTGIVQLHKHIISLTGKC